MMSLGLFFRGFFCAWDPFALGWNKRAFGVRGGPAWHGTAHGRDGEYSDGGGVRVRCVYTQQYLRQLNMWIVYHNARLRGHPEQVPPGGATVIPIMTRPAPDSGAVLAMGHPPARRDAPQAPPNEGALRHLCAC